MIELTGAAEKAWHYQIFGDPPADTIEGDPSDALG